MQPGGLRRHPQQLFFPLNTWKNFPLGSKFQKKFCFHYKAMPQIQALGTQKITHQSQLRRNGHSKFQISQYQLGVWINGPPI